MPSIFGDWNFAKFGSVSQVVSASAAVIAFCVAVVAYLATTGEAKNKLSADAILSWNGRQPPNSRPCLELMTKFDEAHWSEIIARRPLSVLIFKDLVLACFSDQDEDELPKLFDGETLTRKGAFLVASRLNDMLEADSFIASFLLKQIGNPQMFDRIAAVICRDDEPIIKRLPDIPRINDSFVAVRQYIKSSHPYGCQRPPARRR
jgi:hypothetical protein